ncbi:hypothetical protein NF212_06790 [Parasalinivibrio latis]|uniref:hypothetical protein n=1 Tax=Parasalinivibrio latis TaxID=2952610 RepID=UPI0030E0002C
MSVLKAAFAGILLCFSAFSQAGIIPLGGAGTFSGTVIGDSGWALENPQGVDFLTFSVEHETELSASATSALIAMGVSLFEGTVTNPNLPSFSNNADFTDLFGNLTYIASSSAVPGLGGSIANILLAPGTYTLITGGNNGGFGFDFTAYNYQLDLALTTISEPPLLAIFLAGATGLVASRRRKVK